MSFGFFSFLLGMALAIPARGQDLEKLVYSSSPQEREEIPQAQDWYRHSYAVVIGISDYDSLVDLPGSGPDAEAVAETLRGQGFEVIEILGREANRLRIAEILGDVLPRRLKPEDRALIYFAGHGVTVGEGDFAMGYLMPVDARLEAQVSTGISMSELQRWLSAYPSKHVMFVADACYSGLALSTRATGLPNTLRDYLRQVTQKPVRLALTAGRADQEAHEWRGHGLFTYFFLRGIEGEADANHDGIVTSAELAAFVEPRVAQTALANWRAEQNPQVARSGQGEFVFLVGGNTARDAAPEPVSGDPSETVFWESVRDSRQAEDLQAYLGKYPDGTFAGLARARLARLLEDRAEPTSSRAAPASGSAPTVDFSVQATQKSIAVLPFENLSPDPDNEYFAAGITEDVITQLSKIADLRVSPRAAVAGFAKTETSLPEIGRRLHVSSILVGSVRRAGNRVRISSQLIDAATQRNMWAEHYDRDLADIFEIQSDVAQKIASALQASLSPAEKELIDKKHTTNLTAYDFYLKGREAYNRYRPADNDEAVKLFQKALELDPGYALARAGLADAYALKSLRFGLGEIWCQRAIEQAQLALRTDPNLAEGHKALGLAYSSKGWVAKAIEANSKAVQLKPNYYPAVGNVGFLKIFTGSPEDALPWLQKLFALDPTRPFAYAGSGLAHLMLDDRARAEEFFKLAIALQPEFADPHIGLIALHLIHGEQEKAERLSAAWLVQGETSESLALAGEVRLSAGDFESAAHYFERASLWPETKGYRRYIGRHSLSTLRAYALAKTGQAEQSAAESEKSLRANLEQIEAGSEWPYSALDQAAVMALRGETDAAFQWLERAVRSGFLLHRALRTDPLLKPVRDDARFDRLIEDIQSKLEEKRRRMKSGG